MGIVIKNWDGTDQMTDLPVPTGPKGHVLTHAHQRVKQQARIHCVNEMCVNASLLEQTQEDEEIIQYDGACSTCGFEYHLILKKETAP